MSITYSQKCKLFIFPREYLQAQWLEELNIIVVHEENKTADLLYFIVLKVSAPNDSHMINPHIVFMNGSMNTYIIKKSTVGVMEEQVDMRDASLKRLPNSTRDRNTKKMNIQDVRLGADHNLHNNNRKNNLKDLLNGNVQLSSKKDTDEKDSYRTESNLKRRSAKDAVLDSTRNDHAYRGMSSDEKNLYNNRHMSIEKTFNDIFVEKQLNSDQKLFVDKYDDYEVQVPSNPLIVRDIGFENEDNLQFSDDGNNSIPEDNQFDFSGKRYMSDINTFDQERDYADAFYNTMDHRLKQSSGLNDRYENEDTLHDPVITANSKLQRRPLITQQKKAPPAYPNQSFINNRYITMNSRLDKRSSNSKQISFDTDHYHNAYNR